MSSNHIIVAGLIRQGKVCQRDLAEVVRDQVVEPLPHLVGAAVGHPGAGRSSGGQAAYRGKTALGEHQDLAYGVLIRAAGQSVAAALAAQPLQKAVLHQHLEDVLHSRAESAALRAESFAPEDGTLLSVNGKGGAVVLDAQDVGALPAPVAPQAGALLRVLSIRSDGSLVVDTVTPAALKTLLEAT